MDIEAKPSSAELKADLDGYIARKSQLDKLIANLKAQLGGLEAERYSLMGSWNSYGTIKRTRENYEAALLRESDETAISVVWQSAPHYNSDLIIRKVTGKRIFVSQRGHSATSQYTLDGESVSGWSGSKIDIAATFGTKAIDAKTWAALQHERRSSEPANDQH